MSITVKEPKSEKGARQKTERKFFTMAKREPSGMVPALPFLVCSISLLS